MKRLIVTLFIAMFALSLPLSAQADSSRLAALEGEVAAFLNPGERSALAEDEVGGYGAIIAYYTVEDGWWTGLVVYNNSTHENDIRVGCLDASGKVVAAGTFSLRAPSEFQAKILSDFMTSGTIADVGSIVVFGNYPFLVDRYFGYHAGFGEHQFESEAY